ncbi:MAG: DUF4249 family protein [Ignavibacteriae bacterium]|nr:DUF4249 family protein [Ignavibacteriota bacterium]
MTKLLLLLFCCIVLISCSEPFEPKGPYNEQLVVYGILNAESDTQYVRVYTTYNPDGFDPFTNVDDKQIDNATVTLEGPGIIEQFQDTMVVRDDKSRYPSDISPYILAPFSPTPGATYALNVVLPSGQTASGTASVPGPGVVNVRSPHIVQNPGGFSEDIAIEASIAPQTRGLLVRMYVEFQISNGSVTELRREEVPLRVSGSGNSVLVDPVYPSIQRRTSLPGGSVNRSEYIYFQNEAYRAFRENLKVEYSGWSIIYRRAVFILWQAEPNLYNYYNIVNGFRDEISIRTDEPDYASISGGLGVFGAMTIDTTYVPLPQ